MSVSLNLTGVEPYNSVPTTVQIDITADTGNIIGGDTSNPETGVGSWQKATQYSGSKPISLFDHVTKSESENLLSPETASLDNGIGNWEDYYTSVDPLMATSTITHTSLGPAKNLLPYKDAMLEGPESTTYGGIGGWNTLASSSPLTGTKEAFLAGGLGNTSLYRNLLSTDTASLERSVGTWVVNANCASLTRTQTSPLIGKYSLVATSTASGACSFKTGAVSVSLATTDVFTAMASIKRGTGNVTTARIGIKWSGGTTTWGSSVSTINSGNYTTIIARQLTAPVGTTTAQVIVEYTAVGASNTVQVDKVSLAYGYVASWYYPTSATSTNLGYCHGVLVNSDLNTSGVGTNRVFSSLVSGAVPIGETRSVSADLSTKNATYVTSARVGISWEGTSEIDWGSSITPSSSSWTQATATGSPAVANTGFRVVIEFTIASNSGAQAEGYFNRVSATNGSTAYWSAPGVDPSNNQIITPYVGDGYGVVTGQLNCPSLPYTILSIWETGTKSISEGETVSVLAKLSARDASTPKGQIGIFWTGADIDDTGSEIVLTPGVWTDVSHTATAPAGATGWRVLINFRDIVTTPSNPTYTSGGLFDRVSTTRTDTPEWSYPASSTAPDAGAEGAGYGVFTTTDSSSGTVRLQTESLGVISPGDTRSILASFARGDGNSSTARIGILWIGAGSISWGSTQTLSSEGTWYESTLTAEVAPAGTTSWSLIIEFDTTGGSTALYFDKIAANIGSTVEYSSGSPRALSLYRSTAGYPQQRILYDTAFLGTATYFDRSAPIDQVVNYLVTWGDNSSSLQSDSESITLSTSFPTDDEVCYPCLISDPTNPDLTQAATLQIYRPFEYEPRQSVNEVVGSQYPIVLSGKRSAARGSITMITHTQNQADMMRDIFSSGRSLMFRVVSDARQEKPAVSIAVSKVSEEPVILTDITRPERKWNIDFVEISPPVIAQLFVTETRWADIVSNYNTWAVLLSNTSEARDWYNVVSNPAVIN